MSQGEACKRRVSRVREVSLIWRDAGVVVTGGWLATAMAGNSAITCDQGLKSLWGEVCRVRSIQRRRDLLQALRTVFPVCFLPGRFIDFRGEIIDALPGGHGRPVASCGEEHSTSSGEKR